MPPINAPTPRATGPRIVVVNNVINLGTNTPATLEIAYGKAVIKTVFPAFLIASSKDPPEITVVKEPINALDIVVVKTPANAEPNSFQVPAKISEALVFKLF